MGGGGGGALLKLHVIDMGKYMYLSRSKQSFHVNDYALLKVTNVLILKGNQFSIIFQQHDQIIRYMYKGNNREGYLLGYLQQGIQLDAILEHTRCNFQMNIPHVHLNQMCL